MSKIFGFLTQRQQQTGLPKDQIIEQIFILQQKNKINKKYEFPASFKKAKLHKKAVKFGYNEPITNKNQNGEYGVNDQYQKQNWEFQRHKLCACCNLPINTQSIGICYNTSNPQLQNKPFLLNSSAAMFFSFIKMAIVYLLLVFMVCGAFNLVTSIDGNFCMQNSDLCEKNLFEMISSYNKYKDIPKRYLSRIEDILCLAVVVGSIFFFIFYRKIQYNIHQSIDSQHQTQDDYTIFVENIPVLDPKDLLNGDQIEMIEFDYETKLKLIFQKQIQGWIRWMQDQNLQDSTIQKDLQDALKLKNKTFYDIEKQNKITTVSLCFDLEQLQRIQKERQTLMDEQITLYNLKSSVPSETAKDIQKQINALNKVQLNLCERFASDNSPTFNITHFVGKAFVSFQYQHFREYIMQKYQDKSREFKFGNKTLKLSRASHPTDIYWRNMKISDQNRTIKMVISYLIIAMILFFSAAAFIGIDYIKMLNIKIGAEHQSETNIINYGLSIFASVIAVVINNGIYYIALDLTEYERHKTMTNKLISLIIKIFISQFINTAFIFYLIQVYHHRPYMSSAGLVVQVSSLIVVYGFMSIFNNAVYFPFWLRKLNLWYKYRYIMFSKAEQEVPNFQIRLNKDYEFPVFNIAGRYSYYILQVYTCMFYCYLIPVGVLAVAIIFGIQYWIDKIIMFKLSSQYKEIGYFLSRMILKIFEGSLLFFTLGNLIFSSIIQEKSSLNIIDFICFGITVVYVGFISLAPTVLERRFFGKYESFQKQTYQDCIKNHKFTEKYWTQNPATVFSKQVDINDNQRYIRQMTNKFFFGIKDILDNTLDLKDNTNASNDKGV